MYMLIAFSDFRPYPILKITTKHYKIKKALCCKCNKGPKLWNHEGLDPGLFHTNQVTAGQLPSLSLFSLHKMEMTAQNTL